MNSQKKNLKAQSEEYDDEFCPYNTKPITKEKNSKKRWTAKENAKYSFFLKKHAKLFENSAKRRCCKIFKRLSKHIKSKTPNQCKSRHQKMIHKYHTINEIISILLTNKTDSKQLIQKMMSQSFDDGSKHEVSILQSENNFQKTKQDSIFDVLIKFDQIQETQSQME